MRAGRQMRLTGLQIFWILCSFITGNTMLITISPTATQAMQDTWISYLLAAAAGLLIVLVASKAGSLRSGQTILEYGKSTPGKWLGIVLIVNYLIQWYSALGNLLLEYAEFAIDILLPTTPSWLFYISILLLAIYVVYAAGIESIGRCSEVFGPIIVSTVLLLVILDIPSMNAERLLPVYFDSGMLSIMKGSLYPLSFFGESAFMLMILTFAEQPKKSIVWAMGAYTMSVSLVTIVVLSVLMTLGPVITAKQRYPAFDTISFINVMNFIQNLEIVAILIWILSVFIKISVYFFLASYGTAQLFKIKKWRKTTWFVAAFVLTEVMIIDKMNISYSAYINVYWIPYALPVNMILIPLLFWIVGMIKNEKAKVLS
jgi:spore germination protein KB